ncbi:hypothetical protein V5O48_015745 [Marasmius crinis-equi]|uniref:L-tryptophan decarboxylase PsiD-like domain-containing protein n=1 Tax=Marasmius crinis-equi TaxID=585013 RepID=A0ABR3ETQ7_9AGAR
MSYSPMSSICSRREAATRWSDRKILALEQLPKSPHEWSPVIRDFLTLIEEDPVLCINFRQMFEQIPDQSPYNKDPTGKSQVRDYKLMLGLFNHIITCAPEWEDNHMVGFPIDTILNWPMNTPAGQVVFSDSRVNAHLKKMFDVWAEFLSSKESTYVLTKDDGGWLNPVAIPSHFERTFICDPSDPHYGFQSWDDFFTRRFRVGVRPVADPNNDSVITSACESSVSRISHNAQRKEKFWLKGQPYSLEDMFNHDPFTHLFVGGTVYQGYLNATSYHRWHSPVNGVVIKIVHIPGTYYLVCPATGFGSEDGPDVSSPDKSESYISHTATRVLVFLESDNPRIGLMCFIAIGMAEVSTCQAVVSEGTRVRKGDELGMFHFGGSTHCLIFRSETKLNFAVGTGDRVLLNEKLARVS